MQTNKLSLTIQDNQNLSNKINIYKKEINDSKDQNKKFLDEINY